MAQLSLPDRILHCTNSLSNWKIHADPLFDQLISKPEQNTKIFLSTIAKILLIRNPNGRNQFYAVYLLSRILLQPECPLEFLQIFLQTREVLTPIYQAAQYDSNAGVRFNERGLTFFNKNPAYNEAVVGINFVRLCLELVLYLKKLLTQKKPENPSLSGPLKEIEQLIHRKDMPTVQWFMGPVTHQDTELAYYNFNAEKDRPHSPIRFIDHPNTTIDKREVPGSKRTVVHEISPGKQGRNYQFYSKPAEDEKEPEVTYYHHLNTCELEDDDDQGNFFRPNEEKPVRSSVARGPSKEQVKKNAQAFLSSKGFDTIPKKKNQQQSEPPKEKTPTTNLGKRMEEFGLFSFAKKASIPDLKSQNLDDFTGGSTPLSRIHTTQYLFKDPTPRNSFNNTIWNQESPKKSHVKNPSFNNGELYHSSPVKRENEMLNMKAKALEQELHQIKSHRDLNLKRENELLKNKIEALLNSNENMHHIAQDLVVKKERLSTSIRSQQTIKNTEFSPKPDYLTRDYGDIYDEGEDPSATAKTASTQAHYRGNERTSMESYLSRDYMLGEEKQVKSQRREMERSPRSTRGTTEHQRRIFESVFYEKPSLLLTSE